MSVWARLTSGPASKHFSVWAILGCLMLLQSWAWYRLPFLAPRFNGLPTYPFAKRMASNRSSKTTIGLVQDIPQEPKNLDAIHRVDKRGNQDANWATKHAHWIEYWSQRRDQVLRGPEIQYPIHTQEYNIWYRINSKLFLSSETQLRDPRQINLQTPTTQTQMYQPMMNQPMMNQPMTSQLPMSQPSSSSYNIQPGRMSFHYEPSQHHRDRVDDLMPQRHSFSTDHNDFFTTLLGTPESANMHLNHIDFNFNQDGAGPSSFMVNDNIFPTGQTNTTEDPPTVEHRGRSRRPRQPPRCGTSGHLGNL
ncbi:hypothetical protein Lal_00038242 [Lupinus albus]|nr:hypothetical protein Lal_00038242 [Lupinus albus]